MTSNSGFKVTVYLEVEYLKTYVLGTKLLKNTNRKPYTMYRMREERGGAYRGGRPPTACLKRVTDILSCRFIELHYVG